MEAILNNLKNRRSVLSGGIVTAIFFCALKVFAADEITVEPLFFRADSGRAYLELHIDLPRGLLQHCKESDGWYGAVRFRVLINQDSLTLAQDEWTLEDLAADPALLAGTQRIVDARIYELPAGSYGFIISARDSISGKVINLSEQVEVEGFPAGRLNISSVQLSGYILPPGAHPRFDRGSLTMIPNPRRLFGPPGPIYYFAEIYPPTGDDVPRDYTIHRAVVNAYGDTLLKLPSDQQRAIGPFIDVDSISISGLPMGVYTFTVKVEGAGSEAGRTEKFFIVREDGFAAGATAPLDSAQVEEEFRQVSFLLNRAQVESAKQLGIGDKAAFLDSFWKRFDNDPRDADIPLRRSFLARVKLADERFGNSRSPGHQTDRGRIYSMFGEPDDREAHPIDLHAKPYEIWTYRHIEGGVMFAFVDRSGFGEYSLMHSTLRGEVNNPDWYELFVVRSGTETRK